MAILGIMQGRMVPPPEGKFQCFPRGQWDREFALAADAGLKSIEWIYDHYGADDNPLATDAGLEKMLSLQQTTGVIVQSLCADWFMESPLVSATELQLNERLDTLRWLLGRCSKAGIRHLTIPFVDASRIENDRAAAGVAAAIRSAVPTAEQRHVEIHLETSLAPSEFAKLLALVDHPMVKVNYDSGNSSSLGYKVDEEFAAYGHRVGSIHIKDRLRGGGTVPLGAGNSDLPGLFASAGKFGYRGDFILQVARGKSGDELVWARKNVATVAPMIEAMWT